MGHEMFLSDMNLSLAQDSCRDIIAMAAAEMRDAAEGRQVRSCPVMEALASISLKKSDPGNVIYVKCICVSSFDLGHPSLITSCYQGERFINIYIIHIIYSLGFLHAVFYMRFHVRKQGPKSIC